MGGTLSGTIGNDNLTAPDDTVLQGDFTAHDFHIASDGATGSLITWG